MLSYVVGEGLHRPLGDVDHVVIAAAATPETRHMFDARRIALISWFGERRVSSMPSAAWASSDTSIDLTVRENLMVGAYLRKDRIDQLATDTRAMSDRLAELRITASSSRWP